MDILDAENLGPILCVVGAVFFAGAAYERRDLMRCLGFIAGGVTCFFVGFSIIYGW